MWLIRQQAIPTFGHQLVDRLVPKCRSRIYGVAFSPGHSQASKGDRRAKTVSEQREVSDPRASPTFDVGCIKWPSVYVYPSHRGLGVEHNSVLVQSGWFWTTHDADNTPAVRSAVEQPKQNVFSRMVLSFECYQDHCSPRKIYVNPKVHSKTIYCHLRIHNGKPPPYRSKFFQVRRETRPGVKAGLAHKPSDR